MRTTHLCIALLALSVLPLTRVKAEVVTKFEVSYAVTNYTVGTTPKDVFLGNLRDQDTWRDLIVADSGTNTISVRLCKDDGTFGVLTNYPVGLNPVSVRSGDLDGGNGDDVVVATFGEQTISVLFNRGNGTLGTNEVFLVGSTPTPGPIAISIGQANLDSRPDIVVANYTESTVSVLTNMGGGLFSAAENYPVGSGPSSILIKDIVGDLRPDLLTANKDAGTLSVLEGGAGGTFNAAQTITLFPGGDPQPIHALAADFNNDLLIDIVTLNSASNTISILLKDLGGVFTISTNYSVGTDPKKLLVRDLNGDDFEDIVVVNSGDDNIQVLLGMGDGTFQSGGTFAVGNSPEAIAGSNFDAGGLTDLAVVNSADDDVSILVYDLPLAFSANRNAIEDVASLLSLQAKVANGRTNNYLITTAPANGTLSYPVDTLIPSPLTNLFYTGNTNFFGSDSFTYQVTDGISTSAVATVTINVINVNDAPSFDLITNEVTVVAQGAVHSETIAQNIASGAGETGQGLTFIVSTTNSSFFAVQPAISPTGVLTFTPAINAAGTNEVSVALRDDGGTGNGGINQSAAQTFTVVLPVFPPVVSTAPVNQTVVAGEDASFSVVAGGVGPFGYQWSFEGTPIGDATDSTLTVPSASAADVGTYSVDVSNTGGFVTASASLAVNADGSIPTVKLVSPKALARVLTGPLVSVTGTATDNARVSKVLLGINGGAVTNEATLGGTATAATWSANLSPRAGTNAIVVKAVDFSDNESSAATSQFTFVVAEPISLSVTGLGSVTGITNGQLLEIEKSYTATAVAGLNNVFSNWTGSVTSDTAKVTFTMQSNLMLTAEFVANPFIAIQGFYNGLFVPTNAVTHESSGFFRIKLKADSAWSGYLLLDGDKVSVKGRFSLDGTDTVTVSRAKQNKRPLLVSLDLKMGTTDEQVVGLVSELDSLDPGANTNWTAALLGDRLVWATNNPATAWTNRYTMVLPPDTNSTVETGYGAGVVLVNTNGAVTFSGYAGDSSVIKQKTSISKNGQWPLYVPLYLKKNQFVTNALVIPETIKTNKEYQGSIIGWVNLVTTGGQPTLHPEGTLSWIKTTGYNAVDASTDTYYGNGFTNELTIVGSRYLPPLSIPPTRVINETNLTLLLFGGNLVTGLTNSAPFSERNAMVFASTNNPDKIRLSVVPKTGLFKGGFTTTVDATNRTVKTYGAILQDQNYGRGVFLGTNEAGSALLDPTP